MNRKPVAARGRWVVYWMVAYRRSGWNFSLQRAVDWATELERPLVILEGLRVGYRWASDRFHRFVLDGMLDQVKAFHGRPVSYYPYLEPKAGAGSGLLEALVADACVVVSDDFPCFFIPRMQSKAASRLRVRMECVDSNGLLPIRAVDRVYPSAYHFRRALQKHLPDHIHCAPSPDPTDTDLPEVEDRALAHVFEQWPPVDASVLEASPSLAELPIDHDVPPVPFRGGRGAGLAALGRFLASGYERYAERRNHPDDDAQSGLSPYLHWGNLSAHEVFRAVAEREAWSPHHLATSANGKRHGWWGMGQNAEAFLDELVTWRELGFNMTARSDNYDRYESLPEWARTTLEVHSQDPRPALYSLHQLENAQTHDKLWNAAQRQLVREGRIQNYLRMLWGKKIVEWTESPHQALEYMIQLNNKFAVDGRDPNSYSGIFWCLGRYDRPWQERPVFGKIRYMTSASARRKLDLDDYLDRYGEPAQVDLF